MFKTEYMMSWICFLVLFSCVRGSDTTQSDCKVSSYGHEFVFGFVDLPYWDTLKSTASSPDISITVTTRSSTTIYITLQSTANSASKTPTEVTTQYYVYQNREISFNSSFINQYHNTATGGVINVTSDDPISLMAVYKFSGYQENHIRIVSVLPTNALSTSYVIPSYKANTKFHGKNQFMMIGLNDSTSVRFEGYETGSMVYTVDHDDVFIYQREVDISSTSAESNHPVAIFSYITSGESRVPTSKTYSRSLTMQVPPLDRTAVHFIVPSLTGNSVDKYMVRIYASSHNAFVQIHSTSDDTQTVHVYNKIFYELSADSSDVLEILSDSPLVVVQIALNSYGYALFMTEIPAVSQFLNSYYVRFPSGIKVAPSTYLVVTVPSKEVSGLLINRKPAIHDSSRLTKSPLGNYTILSLSASSTVSVTHAGSQYFGVIAQGNWQTTTNTGPVNEAYGFQAGMQFTKPDCGSVKPSGQIVASNGKSFIFGFVDLPFYSSRFSVTEPQISVLLITEAFANVAITVLSSSPTSKTLNTVTSMYYVNKTQVVPFNSSLIYKYQDTSSGGVINLTSDVPVSVLMVYKNGATYTTCPVLPTSAVSTSYVIPSFDVSHSFSSQAQLFVSALNDSTTVRFEGFETGSVVQPLKQNEIFMYQRDVDLSGTIVTSNNPVVIISSVTDGNLIMQTPPVDRYALHFIIPSLRYHHNDRIIRIYAPFKSANLEIRSTSLHAHTKYVTVYPKIFYEIKADYMSVLEIVSDRPVVVVHTTLNSKWMTNIPAVSQFLNTYPVDIGYQGSPFASFTLLSSTKRHLESFWMASRSFIALTW